MILGKQPYKNDVIFIFGYMGRENSAKLFLRHRDGN